MLMNTKDAEAIRKAGMNVVNDGKDLTKDIHGMTAANEKFIDGSWYDREYTTGHYRREYHRPHPQWAVEADRYCVDVVTMFTGCDKGIKILDLGSGTGHFMRAWKSRGFSNVSGIEISQVAVDLSGEPTLIQGTIADMPFKDKEFDLVFSSAVLEHIDDSILPAALSECLRVGKRQAHSIGLDKGTDPSHINIKTISEWQGIFRDAVMSDMIVFSVPHIMGAAVNPFLFCIREDMLTYPLRESFKNKHEGRCAT